MTEEQKPFHQDADTDECALVDDVDFDELLRPIEDTDADLVDDDGFTGPGFNFELILKDEFQDDAEVTQ